MSETCEVPTGDVTAEEPVIENDKPSEKIPEKTLPTRCESPANDLANGGEIKGNDTPNGSRKWKPAVVTSTTNSKCTICTKTVYPMEKITADSQSYHKTCFRCTECNRCLTLGSFAQLNQLLYCKPHFKQLFKLKGNYDEGFQRASHSLRFKTSADAGTHSK